MYPVAPKRTVMSLKVRLREDAFKVSPVLAVGEHRRERLQLRQRKEALPKGGFLRAADFNALAFLDRLHVSRGLVQTAAGPRIQPGKSPVQPMYPQLAALQIGQVHIGDF